jgi:hypothetical protein
MRRARLLLARGLIGLPALLAILYVGDDLFLRYRLAHGKDGDLLEAVTYYVATLLKNGRVEVFYDQPQTEVCVHALFPHLGYNPCWYVTRHTVRRIALFTNGSLRGLTWRQRHHHFTATGGTHGRQAEAVAGRRRGVRGAP